MLLAPNDSFKGWITREGWKVQHCSPCFKHWQWNGLASCCKYTSTVFCVKMFNLACFKCYIIGVHVAVLKTNKDSTICCKGYRCCQQQPKQFVCKTLMLPYYSFLKIKTMMVKYTFKQARNHQHYYFQQMTIH